MENISPIENPLPWYRHSVSLAACMAVIMIFYFTKEMLSYKIDISVMSILSIALFLFNSYIWKKISRWGRTIVQYKADSLDSPKLVHLNLLFFYIVCFATIVFANPGYWTEEKAILGYVSGSALAMLAIILISGAIVATIVSLKKKRKFIPSFYQFSSMLTWVCSILYMQGSFMY